MHYLFSSTQLELARRFQQFIQQQYQYQIQIQQGNEYFHLYLLNDEPDVIKQVQDIAAQFMQNPVAAQFSQAEWQNGTTLSFAQLFRPINGVYKQLHWRNLLAIKFTFFITLLCVAIYGLTLIAGNEVFAYFHFPELPFQTAEFWRYLSHTLVHLSLAHLLFNLLWWWIFAGLIERYQGTGKLLFLYLFSGVISGFAQYFASGPAFFGLSGVVYAVLGYVWLSNYFDPLRKFNIPTGFSWFLIIGIVSGFFSPLLGISMGNSAHIAGLISGCLLVGFDILWNKHKSQ
ncbi:intramembrane serine protease GlpG [Gallibacterium salpingitidis]|uniref:Intramembrane serine protease GlpG n=1 Tax=Gallibacterium salpingitidis TaxID=505341 RepID=A0AB36DZA7_9PAST|nr:rhomboid family intramembrane serine protease [Gallibacterium salpingitidis]OBX06267.1 intramembrane serine protease GlpG [Gallibacterium salpingitidis]OBX06404.1 intramembrane serine protease GlpG [Gallibacterium salpingitidis]WKS99630.1 rhomboid family intramembrane serine protease [Gallibacterium salpingitidis]